MKIRSLKTALLFFILAGLLVSCGGVAVEKDNELKSFMLGGAYFVRGYGGQAKFDEYMVSNGADKQTLVNTARDLLILPFKPSDPADHVEELSSWEVSNKDDLTKILGELKNHNLETSHTNAFDYARYVNLVCIAYGAEVISESEAKALVAEVLPLAQKDYKTWEEYFADFGKGRNQWDMDESAEKSAYHSISQTITQGDNSIYNIVPLN